MRERYQLSGGDISRGERQQTFLKALMLKVLSSDTLTNPVKLASLVSAATSNLTIDQTLEVGDVQKLALSLRSLHGDQVRFITAPLRGFGTAANGASIDLVDTAMLEEAGPGDRQRRHRVVPELTRTAGCPPTAATRTRHAVALCLRPSGVCRRLWSGHPSGHRI